MAALLKAQTFSGRKDKEYRHGTLLTAKHLTSTLIAGATPKW
jgi:hypothetical protein